MTTDKKVAFIGDVHIGNHKKFGGDTEKGINKRCKMTLDALYYTYMLMAADNKVDSVVILGDLFDSPKVSPQIIAATQNILQILPTVVLCGNHDQFSDAEGDNALAPLSPVAEVFDTPEIVQIAKNTDIILVPYQKGKCRDWLKEHTLELLKQGRNKQRILAFHAGLYDDKTPHFLRDSDAAICTDEVFDMCKGKIEHVFAGHWHNRKTWGYFDASSGKKYSVIQAGALVPTGWNNPGMEYGVVYIYDAVSNTVEHLCMPGPRFLTATLDDDIGILKSKYPYANKHIEEGIKVHLRLKVSESESELAYKIIEAGKKSGTIEEGEVEFYSGDTEKANYKAAKVTRSSKTMEEALDNYTSLMPLKSFRDISVDESSARADIKEKSREYMKVTDAY